MKRRALKPWHGIVFFIFIMFSFFFICVPMQMAWGIYGLAGTELLILLIALAFAVLMGYPLKVLFPVRAPKILPLIGTFLMWFCTYLAALVVTLIQYRLFPGQMSQVSTGLNDVIYSAPLIVSIFIVAIMPAVCEEAVHRGIILHTLYSVRREWIIVLVMGIYFGVFHSSIFRFLPTAILGAVMSYIMLESENMIYSSFFHCINNLLPMLLQQMLLSGISEERLQQSSTQLTSMPLLTIGIYLVFSTIVPFGFYVGNYLLHYVQGAPRRFFPEDRHKRNKVLLGILIPTVGLFVIGAFVTIVGIFFDSSLQDILR
jgi:membrane protease YdiL (CAAX protease family)